MSKELSKADLERRFREVEALLDREVATARAMLRASGISISDRSNRSGFEKSGYPYFLWEHRFAIETREGTLISLARVSIAYFQPWRVDELESVISRRTSERFQVGTHGARERAESRFGLSEFLSAGLGSVVIREVDAAKRALAAL